MKRTMVQVVQGYFDDSGSDTKSPVYVLGGLFGVAAKTGTASEKWYTLLDKLDIPYWHTNSARSPTNRSRVYPGIEEKALLDLEIELAQMLCSLSNSRDIATITIVMNKRLFDEEIKPRLTPAVKRLDLPPSSIRSLMSPTYVLLHHAFLSGHVIASRMYGAQTADAGLQIFMEDAETAEWQDEVCPAARAFRRLAPKKYKLALRSFTFAPGKGRVTMPMLEAADLIAWHARSAAAYPEKQEIAAVALDACHKSRVILHKDILEDYVESVNYGRVFHGTDVESRESS